MGASEYHISLSRTVVLRQPQLASFVEALRLALRRCPAARAVPVGGPHEFANDTRTRFFAAVELGRRSPGHAAVSAM
eukprot:303998-Prymnesium_polylepis.1